MEIGVLGWRERESERCKLKDARGNMDRKGG
jgi:hypothetical protein